MSEIHQRRNGASSSSQASHDSSFHLQVRRPTAKERVKYLLPILQWLPQYNVKRDLMFDIVAGITVAMMLIPQEVSLSKLMQVAPEHGLYTAASAPFIYALFGSSTVLSVASGSEVSLLVGSTVSDIEDEETRTATVVFYSFLSGAILLVLRALNLSQIADFFSRPVMGGFISAGGLLIMLSQVKNWLDVKVKHEDFPPVTVYRVLESIPHTNITSFVLGLVSIVLLLSLRIIKRKFLAQISLNSIFEEDADTTKDEESESLSYGSGTQQNPMVLTPVNSNNQSHGFSLTDQQYVSMEHMQAQRSAVPESPTTVVEKDEVDPFGEEEQEKPMSKTTLLLLFVAKTVCDLGPLIVCILGGVVGYIVGPERLELTGDVPSGYGTPRVPWYGFNEGLLDAGDFGSMIGHACSIAAVVYLSSIAMSKRLAIKRGEDINTDQELMGLGMASIVCGFLTAIPSTGAMSRTAVNMQNARTQLASICTVLIIIIALYTMTSALYYLPAASLAAIIIVAGSSLVEMHEAKWLYQVKKDEFFVWLAAFVLTLGLGVLNGLFASIISSVLALMYKTKTQPVAVLAELDDGSLVDRSMYPYTSVLEDVVALRVESSLYFANCERVVVCIEQELSRVNSLDVEIKGVVLDARHMNDMDATTLQVLSDLEEKLARKDLCLGIAHANGRISDMMTASKLSKRLVAGDPSITLEDAIARVRLHPTSSPTA